MIPMTFIYDLLKLCAIFLIIKLMWVILSSPTSKGEEDER